MGSCQLDSIKESKMRSLTLLLFLPFILAECPEGWWKAGDACYFTSQQNMSWFEAQELCWSLGGALAEFKDKAEESHVSSFLDIDRHFWIGLDDLAHEGVFKWAETHQETEYTNWLPGQPDDLRNEDCVCTFSSDVHHYFAWNDAPCDTTVGGSGHGYFALCKTDYKA